MWAGPSMIWEVCIIYRRKLQSLRRLVHFSTLFFENVRHFLHAFVHRLFFIYIVLLCILPQFLCDAHRAELGPTHGAKVSCLGRLLREGGIMEEARCDRVQRQVELVVPAEFKPRFGEGIIPLLSIGVSLRCT